MIFAMLKAGASTRAIVAQTGVSKSTICNLRAKYMPTSEEGVDSVQTSVQTSKPPSKPHARAIITEPSKSVQTDEAFAGLCRLIDPLLDGMALTRAIKDGKDRAIAETKYAEALIKVYSKLGSWQGLDNPEPEPVLTSPVDTWMNRAKEASDE